jgi:hypothetical protein
VLRNGKQFLHHMWHTMSVSHMIPDLLALKYSLSTPSILFYDISTSSYVVDANICNRDSLSPGAPESSLNCVTHLVVSTSGPFLIHDLLPGL